MEKEAGMLCTEQLNQFAEQQRKVESRGVETESGGLLLDVTTDHGDLVVKMEEVKQSM